MIKYKEREETKQICLSYTKADMPMCNFTKTVMRQGWFSVGYHYIIHADGRTEVGIPHTQHADAEVDGHRDSICVLLMGVNEGQRTELQESALNILAEEHNLPINP